MEKLDCILASTSPRRRELLAHLGYRFDAVAPQVDETPLAAELAADYVCRLAIAKAEAGHGLTDGKRPVLGSDTIVVLDGQILGKPKDAEDAKATLARLSGRSHQVMTAIACAHGKGTSHKLVVTDVTFCDMSPAQIQQYVASQEPMDKAGSYGIQGLGGAFIRRIDGSYSAVVGLPLVETRELLEPHI